VLIDQEGGRVARLKPPHWRQYPNARTLAEESEEAVYSGARLIADELLPLGINVDCLPLADVPVEGSHDIIGDRAYATNPQDVARFARKAAEGLRDGGVLPVLKHIPGHGRAMVDSHEDLPVVSASLEELERTDFIPFKALNDLPLGMTAHVLYEALDKENVATLSATVIRYIREQIGFDGLLMSDDISMKALNGDFADLSHRTLVAGCDLVLHCNGDMAEMEAIASAVSPLSDAAKRRAQHAWKQGALRQPFDVAAAEARIHALLAESA
ncbi:MAG: glycoside hydrolase family 3 N-terminal domain-containing protein, partial [Rickettsiales bacterium]